MSVLRFVTLLGCSIALLAGLGAWAAPAWAGLLALTAAAGAGGVLIANALMPRRTNEDHRSGMPEVIEAPPRGNTHPERDLLAELEQHKALEQQLLTAKREAEAATMAKGEFLATMSHEIRTPLNGIIPLLDLVLATDLGADQRDYLETAFGSAKELLRIVDDILDYSKLDAQKLQLENIGINLRELASSVIRLMEKSAEAKDLSLKLEIEPAVRLAVRGDPVRLRQVLTNLVSNAIKFTNRGGVSVHIQQLGETRSRNQLRFEVRDTGVGISPEAASQLFQAFTQADTSTTRTFGGTGLGLAICKRIVTLMGGRIGVDSNPGQGSTFWFEVALDKALGDIEGRAVIDFKGLRALLVTANAAQQKRLTTALRNWGAQVVPAANTQEALARMRAVARPGQRSIDLALVDLNSIPSTALALHRALLRETRAEETVRVYLHTGDALPEELRTAPGFHLLARDCPENELRTRILALLDTPVEERLAMTAAPSAPAAPVGIGGEAREAPGPTEPPVATAPPRATAKPPTARTPSPLMGNVSPIRPVQAVRTPTPVAPAAAPAKAAAPVATQGTEADHRILLVEDNPVNRQVAQRLLSLAGLSFDSAENGKEALDRMNSGHYAAVLMDCQMPIMDGYTATRKRREHEAAHGLARTPIIAMTANAMLGDREKCLESGMDDYMSKPLSRALLESTLHEWLQAAPAPGRVVAIVPAPATPTPATGPAQPPAPDHAVNMVTATGPALDLGVLRELREIMGAEFASLVQVFLEDAPVALARIRALASGSDLGTIAAPAHTLKSTSANLGALHLSGLAKAMEMDARQGTLRAAPARAAALAAEYERVAAALRQETGF